jgi:phosphopantetheinyl transferase
MTPLKIDRLLCTEDELLIICDTPLSLEELEADADDEDRLAVEGFTSRSRRRERLMWRRMVRQEVGHPIRVEYSADGAPHIKDFKWKHISVSHCRDVVAVVASSRVCGIDVERKDRNFERVAPRYVSPQEWDLCPKMACDRAKFLATVWCVKEALYKMAAEPGLDFCRDMHITALNLEQGVVECRVKDAVPVHMHIIDREGYLVAYHC